MSKSPNAAPRWLDWTIYGLCFALFVGFIGYCKKQYGKKYSSDETIEDYIRHADTFYWFAMMDHGGTPAIGSGEKYIAKANQKFAEKYAPKRDSLKAANGDAKQIGKIDRLEARIAGTAQDLKYQKVLAHDTFRGVFPWNHYLARPSLFQNPRATATYELIDQPEVVAARSAVKDLTERVIAAQTVTAQHDVVFVVDPEEFPNEQVEGANNLAKQLENEALYLFNLDPRFFVHNMLEVASALTLEEQEKLRQFDITVGMLHKLRAAWGNRDILIVRIRRLDEVKKYHFYLAQGKVYRGVETEPAVVLNNYGFCRDRRFVFSSILFFNVLMLLCAIVGFRVLAHWTAHDEQPPTWSSSLGLGAIGFLWGRVSVWGLAEIVEEFMPADETLAIYSFWWPMITGVVMLLGPALVLRFAEERFHWMERWFGLNNRRGALFASVTFGSVAYLGTAALYVGYWGVWSLLPPLILGAIGAAWILGRALESVDPVKMGWGVAVSVLALGLGPAFASAYPGDLHALKMWAVALPITIVGIVAVRGSGSMLREVSDDEQTDYDHTAVPGTLNELLRLAQNPPFKSTASYTRMRDGLVDWTNGNTARLQIVGPAGIGKTALISELCREARSESRVAVLHGTCPEPHGDSTAEPYRVFADAIADHFSVNLLMPPENQLAGIDKAVDGIFEEVVPFSDLLFPPSHGENHAGSKSELFHSIVAMLRKLATDQRILLIIDDAHWMDSGSAELLDYLLDAFPSDGVDAVGILVASRTSVRGFNRAQTIELEQVPSVEIHELLVEKFGFESDAASQLADSVGNEHGNLHWLFQMITYLAGKEILKTGKKGWTWGAGTRLADHLPDDLRQSIWSAIEDRPEFRPILECAACIGPKFTVEVLAEAVDMSRFECIQLLDRIEEETGFVRDLHDEDDAFAFRSSFLLEVIRQLLGVRAAGPCEPLPQRIREYHSALAEAWNSTLDRSNGALFKLATHRYAAGTRHAHKAVKELIDAASTASRQYQHDQARGFVNMARECASAAGQDNADLERELLLIECHESHVEGGDRVATAARALEQLDANPDSPFDIHTVTARACYDAGIDTRDQKWFAKAVTVGQHIVDRFDAPLQKAEGHHFIGIGLPRDEAMKQREHWQTAMQLIDQAEPTNDALRLKARIANSLAEQLSYAGDSERAAAKKLFETSIELKSRPEIRDVSGLAMSHGGLGRLAFFAKEPDYPTARTHFAENLRLSEQIGSLIGQTKMHSMLGACNLAEGIHSEAKRHYASAAQLASEYVDKVFALIGLIEVNAGLQQIEGTEESGDALTALIQTRLGELSAEDRKKNPVSAIPSISLPNLTKALETSRTQQSSRWHRYLSSLVDNNTELS